MAVEGRMAAIERRSDRRKKRGFIGEKE